MSRTYLPYGRQNITEKDIKAVNKVLKSPYLTQGQEVPKFEEQLAKKTSSNDAIATNSATSALHVACLALGLGKGDRLWTSPITFVASANCGIYCGAEVDFVDIDSKTGLMSTNELEIKLEKAKANNSLPKIIIPVHLAGTSCDMEKISELCKVYGIKIIEDASHAIGGKYNKKPIGSCKYSDATVFSFHPVKIITTGEGGAMCCNDEKLAKIARKLRSHGITKNKEEYVQEEKGPWSYEQQLLGFNYRLTDIQAALGSSQLSRLKNIVKERNKIHNRYIEKTKSLPISILNTPDNCYSARHLTIVKLREINNDEHKEVFKKLRSMGIGVQVHYTPVHLQPYYKMLGFKPGDYPNAEKHACSTISIPNYPGLSDKDQKRVINALSKTISKRV